MGRVKAVSFSAALGTRELFLCATKEGPYEEVWDGLYFASS